MEFLRKLEFSFPAQLSAWPRLPPSRWLPVAVVVVAAVGGLGLLSRTAREADEPLLPGQFCSPREIARMTAAFQKHGLHEARVADQQILVPRGSQPQYLAALDRENALPVELDDAQEQAAASSNPFASRQQVDAALKTADQKKLARIVAGMKGIETASVQYATVKKPGFPPTEEIRAMVAVRAAGDRPLEYEALEAIRDTVTGYVAGLERRHVTVTDLNACRAYSGNEDAGSPHAAQATYAAATRAIEREYQRKIESRLAVYPGVVVGVQVQLRDASRPAAADLSLVPALVTASIDLPRSYLDLVWSKRSGQPPAAADSRALRGVEEEIHETVRQAVQGLLPPPAAGGDNRPQVTVTTYEDLPAAAAPAASPVSRLTAWLLNPWPALALAAVLGLGLWAVAGRRSLRPASAAVLNPEATVPVRPGTETPAVLTDPVPEVEQLRNRLKQAVTTRPGAAAEVLKQWLSDAA
jgi:flagellar biosynthesis/type III secretory pathway M-ring protein FliF/YscJ